MFSCHAFVPFLKWCYLQVSAVVFDKTGTLTVGKPAVSDVKLLAGEAECTLKTLLQLFASAEANSEHPLAKSLTFFGVL